MIIRRIRYISEAIILVFVLLFFRILPLDIASATGGFLMRIFGRFLRANHTADNNIKLAFPELSKEQRKIILQDMWDNLGRVIGEYPHLSRKIMQKRIKVYGLEHLEVIKKSSNGSFFVSGHFANWEIAPLASFINNFPLVVVYRAPNNPYADRIIKYTRSVFSKAMYKKGRDGANNILKAIKQGNAIGMVIDQKMNEGKSINFFGKNVMAATATTAMAIKQQVPLLMARVIRKKGANFEVMLHPPVFYDINADPTEEMQKLYKIFEIWINEYPAQWFWVHKRW